MSNIYDPYIADTAKRYVNNQPVLNVDELFCLIKAIIRKESNFNANAINASKKEMSVGLMQINIKAHNVSKELMLNPIANIDYGTSYLVYQLNRYKNLEKAISAYNAGRAISGNYITYVVPVLTYYAFYKTTQLASKASVADKTKQNSNKDIISENEGGYINLKFLLMFAVAMLIIVRLFK